MAYTNRYIAIPAPYQPADDPMGTQLWSVRDTDDKKTLMGLYSETNAKKLARRLNADINLSPGERRALDLIASCYPVECSALSIARAFKNNLMADDKSAGRIIRMLEGHGLVTQVLAVSNSRARGSQGSVLTGAKATPYAMEWLGKS